MQRSVRAAAQKQILISYRISNCRLTPLPHPGIITEFMVRSESQCLLHPRSAQYGRARKSKFQAT